MKSSSNRFPDEKDPLVRARGPNKYDLPDYLFSHYIKEPDKLSWSFTGTEKEDPFEPTEDQMNNPLPYDVKKPEINTNPYKMDYGSDKYLTDLFPESIPGITVHYPAYPLTSPRGLNKGYEITLPKPPRSPSFIKTSDRFATLPTYKYENTAMFSVMKPSVPENIGPGYYIKSTFPHDMKCIFFNIYISKK